MRRFVLFAGFLCVAAIALGQSTTASSDSSSNSGKGLGFQAPFNLNGGSSGLNSFGQPSSMFGSMAPCTAQAAWKPPASQENDIDHLFEAQSLKAPLFKAPCRSAAEGIMVALNEVQRLAPRPPSRIGGREEPIPTQWPDARLEQIPTRWPNLKVHEVAGKAPEAGDTAR